MIPEALLGGDHEAIRVAAEDGAEKTLENRPDLLERSKLTRRIERFWANCEESENVQSDIEERQFVAGHLTRGELNATSGSARFRVH